MTSLALGTLTIEYSPVPSFSSRTFIKTSQFTAILHRIRKHHLGLLLTEFVCDSKVVGPWTVHQGVQGSDLILMCIDITGL